MLRIHWSRAFDTQVEPAPLIGTNMGLALAVPAESSHKAPTMRAQARPSRLMPPLLLLALNWFCSLTALIHSLKVAHGGSCPASLLTNGDMARAAAPDDPGD